MREHFPLLAECVYLNNNSMGATPVGARAAAMRYYDVVEHWRDERFAELHAEVTAYASELGELLGVDGACIAFDTSTSVLLGRILSALDFRERPRAIATEEEFPSVGFLLRATRRWGAEPVIVKDGSEVEAAIDERTRVVVVSHATYATGALLDPSAIVRRAHACGAIVVLDAYQSIGVVPVDVPALGVDVVLGGAHKWLCGAFDLAFAWVRPDLLRTLEPAATGWMAGKDPFAFDGAMEWGPHRLAAGTPALLPAMTSREGLRLLRGVGIDAIRARSLAMTSRILARADAAGIRVLTPRERRGGIVTLDVPAAVCASLKERGFVASYRRGLRIGPHVYNTDEEIERFMDAVTR